jgi:hypothetical protein
MLGIAILDDSNSNEQIHNEILRLYYFKNLELHVTAIQIRTLVQSFKMAKMF